MEREPGCCLQGVFLPSVIHLSPDVFVVITSLIRVVMAHCSSMMDQPFLLAIHSLSSTPRSAGPASRRKGSMRDPLCPLIHRGLKRPCTPLPIPSPPTPSLFPFRLLDSQGTGPLCSPPRTTTKRAAGLLVATRCLHVPNWGWGVSSSPQAGPLPSGRHRTFQLNCSVHGGGGQSSPGSLGLLT